MSTAPIMPAPKRPTHPVRGFRCPPEHWDVIEELAKAHRCTTSDVLRAAVATYVASIEALAGAS